MSLSGTTIARYSGRDRRLEPSRTAILVVDAQNAEVSEEVRDTYPDFYRNVHETALPAMRRLLDGARKRNAEVIYTVIESMTQDGRDRSLDHKLSNMHIPKGSELAKVIPEVAPQGDEMVVPKTSSGVFNSTNMDYLLRNLGIENVIVVGFVTDQCVDMAIRDGADRGYYMICAHDACASYSEQRHAAALSAFGGYCRLQTVDEVLADFTE